MFDVNRTNEHLDNSQNADSSDKQRQGVAKKRAKVVLFSLAPVIGLILVIELAVRLFGFDTPSMGSPFLDAQFDLVNQVDDELFFSLRPNLNCELQGVTVTTNSDGLRSREVAPKGENEFRILSLGESSTFGAAVEGNQTYSAVLESVLQQRDGSRTFRVINAGVSAYSSFQSLKYLELRGTALMPDMVLFYHEINDILPTTIREGWSEDESSLSLTDKQFYESKQQSIHRRLHSLSATYRAITNYRSRQQISSHRRDNKGRGVDQLVPDVFHRVSTPEGIVDMDMPKRVSVDERREIFRELKHLCDEADIQLVVIHPSYRHSVRHECELTHFCHKAQVPMFEAYDSLHPPGSEASEFFIDLWHPTVMGHRAIAEDLADFLTQTRLLPSFE